jgi:adenylate kinase family enzyme
MSLKVIFLIGRPGCGKGTQLKFLKERTGFSVVNTGELLREKAKDNDIIGKKVSGVLKKGGLIPTPVVFSLWMPYVIECYNKKDEGLIFDGNPRKLYEARMLEELFLMFEIDSPIVIYIKISEEEARLRLERRGREDDNKEDIDERLRWFKEEVEPVLDYYSKKNKLIKINGEQSIEDVSKEIEEKTKGLL